MFDFVLKLFLFSFGFHINFAEAIKSVKMLFQSIQLFIEKEDRKLFCRLLFHLAGVCVIFASDVLKFGDVFC